MAKLRLKRNESFNIREGWLSKGLREVENNAAVFTQENAMDVLGMGSKMVKSLRFWMQAAGLTSENNSGRRLQQLTSLGRAVREYDPYFEDLFTLWIVHYNIAKNSELCYAWNYFFNRYGDSEFTREDFYESAKHEADLVSEEAYSHKSLRDDCNSVVRMYCAQEKRHSDPEDNLSSPFSELGLVRRSGREKGAYNKCTPYKIKLDRLAVLYVILDAMGEGQSSISIEKILKEENNAGRIFNLNKVILNEYLDELRAAGYISINRTAGLDMVYKGEGTEKDDILTEYYRQQQ